jgi:hypothetical protein
VPSAPAQRRATGGPAAPGSVAPYARPSEHRRQRSLTIGLAALAVALIAAAVLAKVLTSQTARSAGSSRSIASALARQARVRHLAAAWVSGNVNHGAAVSCDRVMCAALRGQGFPARNLRPIGPSGSYPLTSSIVVVTPSVAHQFGTSLATSYAPTALAAFGPVGDRIYIRVIAPHGAAAYKSALRADQKVSQTYGTGLMTSAQITASQAARTVLEAGRVDSRLLFVITALAAEHPIDIVAFGGAHLGMTPGTPLRVVDLAETDATAHLNGSAYLKWMEGLLKAQSATYRPASWRTVSLAGGGQVLRIEFPAPTPLGLLTPRS